MATQRLTKAEKQAMTLGELLDLQVEKNPKLESEVSRVKNRLSTFDYEGTNILDYNIKDLDDSPALADFALESPFAEEQRAKFPKRPGMLEIYTRLNSVFNDAGVKTYPNMQARLKEFMSEDQYQNETGYKYYRQRRTLVSSPANTYKELKQVLSNLEGDEKGYLGMKLFSGLRMTDFSKMQVENYNRDNGRISFREGKSGQLKTITLRPAARPFFELLMGDKTSGPLVTNKSALDKAVNLALNEGVAPSVFEDIDGNQKVEKFSLRDLRNLNETILTEAGMSTEEQLFVGGRAPTTEAAKYTKAGTAARQIQDKLRRADALVVGYSQTQDLGQYLADVGVPEDLVPQEARRIYVSSNLLTDDDFLPALSDEFMNSLPDQGTGTAPQGQVVDMPDPVSSAQYRETATKELELRSEEINKAILDLREETRRRIEEDPDLAKPLEIETGQPKPRGGAKAAEKKGTTPEQRKDFAERLAAAMKKVPRGTAEVVGGLAIGASVIPRVGEAQERIEAGEPVVPTVLEQAGQFLVEESPIGLMTGAKEVGEAAVGAALEPMAEEYREQRGEAGIPEEDIETQMGRIFGIQ